MLDRGLSSGSSCVLDEEFSRGMAGGTDFRGPGRSCPVFVSPAHAAEILRSRASTGVFKPGAMKEMELE